MRPSIRRFIPYRASKKPTKEHVKKEIDTSTVDASPQKVISSSEHSLQKPLGFFKLPQDIREIIYKYIFESWGMKSQSLHIAC